MVKIVEYDKVYLEYPDEEELTDENKEIDDENSKELNQDKTSEKDKAVTESRTTRLSIKELQQKLEETQSLHL